MSDDLKKSGAPDSKFISLEQKHEVAYWTREFGVTPMELREAVRIAGNSVAAVREQLGK